MRPHRYYVRVVEVEGETIVGITKRGRQRKLYLRGYAQYAFEAGGYNLGGTRRQIAKFLKDFLEGRAHVYPSGERYHIQFHNGVVEGTTTLIVSDGRGHQRMTVNEFVQRYS